MNEQKVPVQSLIDHIKTAVDVDPWAQKMVEELLTDPQRRCVVFCNQCVYWDKESGLTARRCGYWERYTTQDEFCSHGCKTRLSNNNKTEQKFAPQCTTGCDKV